MKLCGICEKPIKNGEFCEECEERKERMKKGIKDKLNGKGKGK